MLELIKKKEHELFWNLYGSDGKKKKMTPEDFKIKEIKVPTGNSKRMKLFLNSIGQEILRGTYFLHISTKSGDQYGTI